MKRVPLHFPDEFTPALNAPPYPPSLVEVPFLYPDGKVIAMVQCHFDWPHHMVTGAYLLRGDFDAKAFAYARDHNFCFGQGQSNPKRNQLLAEKDL